MAGKIDVSAELSALRHEMKNRDMKSLPATMTVQRRPLYHPPVASPYAGSQVQKVVYVSRNTPIMSAVKRVRKLLVEVEKRMNQSVEAKSYGRRRAAPKAASTDHLMAKTNEEVLVKASGRAIAQALRVGEWFRTKEKTMLCKVEVRAGSTQAVDDIVEVEELNSGNEETDQDVPREEHDKDMTTVLEGGETTMELLGNLSKAETDDPTSNQPNIKTDLELQMLDGTALRKKKRRLRRKRAVYDQDDVPEARLRWVKTVEVAISFANWPT